MKTSPQAPDAPTLPNSEKSAALAASRLRLPLRSQVWRGSAGEFSGAGSGSSMDFQDHRSYVPGDDPRHINWNAYARTGQYSMKLYREEVRPTVELFLDLSASMFVTPEKATRSAELFHFLTQTATRSGATLHLHTIDNNLVRPIPADRLAETVAETVAGASSLGAKSQPKTQTQSPPDLSRAPLRPGALRILVSDLLFPGDPAPLFNHLGQRNGKILLFAPFSQAEANPDWDGNFEFIDPERATRHPHRIDPGVLKRYLASYRNHFALWTSAARRHQALLARIPAEPPLQTALQTHALPIGALEPRT